MTTKKELPPNQALVAPGKWPVIGEKKPLQSDAPWNVTVKGLVNASQAWSLADLAELPQEERVVDIHCVTRWSKLGVRFRGVALDVLLDAAGPADEAQYISFVARSTHRHSTSLRLDDARQLNVLVVTHCEGEPLEESHGGPVRTVVPGRYFYKSVKWLEEIELLKEDRLGTWEAESGYHNVADPWREERYIVRDMDRREVRRLLDARDFSARDLLSITADRMDLHGLQAQEAILRNSSFVEADLRGANFDGAFLANSHFQKADLRGAYFGDADLEGADLRGADLRGANLRGASLFGATFCTEPSTENPWGEANVAGLLVGNNEIAALSPIQQDFLRREK